MSRHGRYLPSYPAHSKKVNKSFLNAKLFFQDHVHISLITAKSTAIVNHLLSTSFMFHCNIFSWVLSSWSAFSWLGRSIPLHGQVVYCVCCICRKGTAEELPFSDGSVDLLTAASAAHWFDQSRFLAEAARVLKPRGCMALLGFSDSNTKPTYQNCGDRLKNIYEEVGSDW